MKLETLFDIGEKVFVIVSRRNAATSTTRFEKRKYKALPAAQQISSMSIFVDESKKQYSRYWVQGRKNHFSRLDLFLHFEQAQSEAEKRNCE